VDDAMTLSVGESESFKAMIRAANKALFSPDHKVLSNILHTKKLETTEKLKALIKGKHFSLTTDHWTSVANENFGAITLHLIKQFELKTFVLSCAKHENGASAEEMVNQLVKDMRVWGLEKDFFVAAVTDSAANMNAFGVTIEGWKAKYLRHHYCVDHIFQLTAVIAFSGNATLENYDQDTSVGCLKKARNLVSHINSSCNANQKLASCQWKINPSGVIYKLLKDVVTRWGSTFALVERVIKLEAPLKLMFEDELRHRTSANQPTPLESFVLTNADFDGLRAILHVLKPLSLAQKALEGDQYMNISLVPLAVHHLCI
jgi:hypothetical protein